MDTDVPLSNDRTRTYWTPTMERFFIDLMLEHMHRGNRIGHTFNKQAWGEMLSVFNAKFGTRYDKDVLKSRYTNLWKQFNDVKNLLGQSGFSWDESRQMVVADEYEWNAYTKVHPDARSYKTKAVLNFNDLCLLYGYTNADGRYSRSSHDLDFDDEVPGVNMLDGVGNLRSSSNERSRTEWSGDMDHYFIELMIDQVGRGNKVDNSFNKKAWVDMLALFNARYGRQHDKRVLRHRHKKLWKYYSDVTVMLKHNGFSWDEACQVITADDGVWDAYIKVHPHARRYRSRAVPNYNELALIFGDAIYEDSLSNFSQRNDKSGIMAAERKGVSLPSDRTRTYWTPLMDSSFIDLLVDQVGRGNGLGQTFITEAWVEMAASFNAKFESRHDKDVLKNRYKHLRRLYGDISLLLKQDGFSWDEKRDMVAAEDCLWDAYIKAHPDLRPYRVKTVPSYHKLRVIFGEECSNGRYNRLADHAGDNGETTILMTNFGDEKNTHFPATPDTSRLEWTPLMDHFLIDLILQQLQGCNKDDQVLDEQAWSRIVQSFSNEFGICSDKSCLEIHYICLRKLYEDISNLLNHEGFFWDEAKQMVVGDDGIWEEYIKEHPDSIGYRDQNLSNYSGLCKIFQKVWLNARHVDECIGMQNECGAHETMTDGTCQDLPYPAVDVDRSCEHRKRQCESNGGRRSKTAKACTEMQELSKMAGVVTNLVRNKVNQKYTTMEKAVNALQALPDIDDELLLDACDLLEDDRKAKTFLALDVSLRKKWLLRKLRP